ncbi:hypothetical protein [Capnocytophaga stomatis]|uniref:hypothetical protein n=1 Tax=Capnocytophaga stomatis TaxID=1848904 RepID=UPI001ACD5489|nr:hypothetical protein [Capnocytophaga stomatis]GIM48615.1 hypothetical protein CAPN003_00670 [Capnocytophaga stomatis]
MTQKEYAQYLAELIGEEMDTDCDELEELFYGYFQSFMPDGKNVEKVFEPIENGQLLYQRIKPIFETTKEETTRAFEQNIAPGYFVPNKKGTEEELKAIGKELLAGLLEFASFVEEETLQNYLSEITEIEISDNKEQNFDDEKHVHLWETLLDWTIDNTDYESLISILREAYYSINCDYFLAAYLQYPNYNDKPNGDFLKPYFELWQRGFRFVINDNKLILF